MNTLIYNRQSDIDKQAQNVVQLLCRENLRLATAESCTGGLLSGAVTSVGGSSGVFGLGVCTYANQMKMKILGVSEKTLENFGAVSAETAAEMALGARRISDAEIGVSITGVAGPDGGTPEKPVGTVYFACVFKEKVSIQHLVINANEVSDSEKRRFIRLESVRQALILVNDTINSYKRIE